MRRLGMVVAAGWTLVGAAIAADRPGVFTVPAPITTQRAPAGVTSQVVKLARAVVTMPDGQAFGTHATYGTICELDPVVLRWNSEHAEFFTKRMSTIFDQEIAAGGFKSGGDSLFDTDTEATLQVGAAIKNVQAKYCLTLTQGAAVRGAVTLDIDWQIYDPLEKRIVGRVSTHAGSESRDARNGGEELIFLDAFRQSIRGLINDPAFRTLALAPTAKATPSGAAPVSVAPDVFGAPIALKTAPQGARALAENVRSVATVIAPSGTGSGFLVSSDGYLLTNEHVVHGTQRVKIKWSDGSETNGEVVRTDARRDVALIRADPGGRAPIPLRKSRPEVGEAVFAIGSPMGAAMQNTVTKGIVSAAIRTFQGQTYIQSDVAVTHGNSGGPLVDEKGAVIGLTDLAYLPTGEPIDINLFIPIGEALQALALRPAMP